MNKPALNSTPWKRIQETLVQDEQGNILGHEKKFTRHTRLPEFMKIYLDDILPMVGKKYFTKLEYDFLMILFRYAEHNTNRIVLLPSMKEEIAAEISTTKANINNLVSRLKKLKILIYEARQLYVLNPIYFFKGDEVTRSQVIRLVFEYKISGNPDEDIFNPPND